MIKAARLWTREAWEILTGQDSVNHSTTCFGDRLDELLLFESSNVQVLMVVMSIFDFFLIIFVYDNGGFL